MNISPKEITGVLLCSASFGTNNGPSEADALIQNALSRISDNVITANPLEIDIALNTTNVFFYHKENELSNISHVLIRGTRGAEEKVYEIAQGFKKKNTVVVDPPESFIYPIGKLHHQIRRINEVPFPKSLFLTASPKGSAQAIEKILTSIDIHFPIIAKPQKGFGGFDVTLLSSTEELSKYLEDKSNIFPIIFQEYLDIKDEYRVVIIGGEIIGTARKDSDAIAKNATQGGTFTASHNADIEKLAQKAASLQPGDIWGVDVAMTKSGDLYIIECNRNPNFIAFREATGIPVEEKIVDFLASR